LQSLIHSSIGIHSLLKRQPLKNNVIDRDKVLVPPNWDSWGKIRVLREGFDVEATSKGWSLDIEEPSKAGANVDTEAENDHVLENNVPGSAVKTYEEIIRDPSLDALQATSGDTNGHKLEVSSLDTQSFLTTQLGILDKMRQGADSSGMDSSRLVRGRPTSLGGDDSPPEEGRVSEHIGPIQFNMGGIQVDADDMLARLRVSTLPHQN
jgi:dynein light intermediate chain 1